MNDSIVKCPDGRHAIFICEYANGKMTTAGLYDSVTVEDGPVTFGSHAAVEMPFDWHSRLWKPDNGIVQKIIDLRFPESEHEDPEDPAFLMEDGSWSWYVEEVRHEQ